MDKFAWQAFVDVCARFGLTKSANMQMLRRIGAFEDLAQHSNPELKAIGGKLLGNLQRTPPKPIGPQFSLPQGPGVAAPRQVPMATAQGSRPGASFPSPYKVPALPTQSAN